MEALRSLSRATNEENLIWDTRHIEQEVSHAGMGFPDAAMGGFRRRVT